jgi:hypothetical protein
VTEDRDVDDDDLVRAIRPVSVILPLVMVAVAFALSYLPRIDLGAAIAAAVGVIWVVGASAVIGGYVGAAQARHALRRQGVSIQTLHAIQRDLESRVLQLKGILERVAGPLEMGPLQSTGEIAQYELGTTAREIWVSSRDLALDLADVTPSSNDEASFDEIVKTNLGRGVNYTYILRDDPTLRHKAEILRQRTLSVAKRGQLEFLFISQDDFERLPYTEGNFAIFNFPQGSAQPVRISAEFPAGDKELWIVVTGEPALRWLTRVAPIVKDARARHLKEQAE